VQYSAEQNSTEMCETEQCKRVQNSTEQYSTIQGSRYSTVPNSTKNERKQNYTVQDSKKQQNMKRGASLQLPFVSFRENQWSLIRGGKGTVDCNNQILHTFTSLIFAHFIHFRKLPSYYSHFFPRKLYEIYMQDIFTFEILRFYHFYSV
jgi:hypothetical protein